MSYQKILYQSFAEVLAHHGDVRCSHDNAVLLSVPSEQNTVTALSNFSEGVHFLANTHADVIAYKAIVASYAKLAAFGAKPLWLQCSIAMPVVERDWLARFAQGLQDGLSHYGGVISSTALTNGHHNVAISAQGLVSEAMSHAIEHQPAEGDAVFVTGTLGDAGLALTRILQDIPNDDAMSQTLEQRFMRPQLPLAYAVAVRAIASAAVVVSEGFIQDLERTIQPFGLGADIQLTDLPLSDEIQAIIERNAAYQCALTGADDYQLCFTAPPQHIEQVRALAGEHDCAIRCVGTLTSRNTITVYDSYGEPFAVKTPKRDHFAELDVESYVDSE